MRRNRLAALFAETTTEALGCVDVMTMGAMPGTEVHVVRLELSSTLYVRPATADHCSEIPFSVVSKLCILKVDVESSGSVPAINSSSSVIPSLSLSKVSSSLVWLDGCW